MARPKLPEGEGKRHNLHIRTTADLMSKLKASAASSGRSMAQEVEFRLEQSINGETLEQTLTRVIRKERHQEHYTAHLGYLQAEMAARDAEVE